MNRFVRLRHQLIEIHHMTKQQIARQEVEAAFENNVTWETYFLTFEHMDAGNIRLTDIIHIARYVVNPRILRIRRREWNSIRPVFGSGANSIPSASRMAQRFHTLNSWGVPPNHPVR